MKRNFSLYLLFMQVFLLEAQEYNDYIGVGHNNNVVVKTSDNSQATSGDNTVNGFGFLPDQIAASRFLGQATMGADYETIQQVAQIGYSDWLDQQFDIDPTTYLTTAKNIWDEAIQIYSNTFGSGQIVGNDEIFPYSIYTQYAWWNNVLTTNDHLRHRMTFALSEIFVVSKNVDIIGDSGFGLASYYDVLYNGAYGNFRDILFNVTMHPIMGTYLSHYNNRKSDPSVNRHPDENYAREVMQLFSIGLYELNEDGTRKKDANGNWIPTYDNNDIKEFAKVFTGLSAGAVWDSPWGESESDPEFGLEIEDASREVPMAMYNEQHEQGSKYLLNNYVVPAGQTGMQDINNAIDNLFNHPNVGPFIGTKLIQFLVKSNPSPDYVARVTAIFNDNGQGVRGDMKAVVRAILLDSEARDCAWIQDGSSGKLREPLVRFTHLMKAFNASTPSGKVWGDADYIMEPLKQSLFASPSVFNFFLPTYQPNGPIADAGLVAPEFQLHNSATSILYINRSNAWSWGELLEHGSVANPDPEEIGVLEWSENDNLSLNLTDEYALVNNPSALVDRLNLILCHGNLSTRTKDIIVNTISQYDPDEPGDIIATALYLLMISPDYVIQK